MFVGSKGGGEVVEDLGEDKRTDLEQDQEKYPEEDQGEGLGRDVGQLRWRRSLKRIMLMCALGAWAWSLPVVERGGFR